MENVYLLSNISSFNIANITESVYVFSNIVSGDPYRIVAEVYDTLDFSHILTNVRLGNATSEYFWPTDDVSSLAFTLETEENGIVYEIKTDIIGSDEIPLFIYTNITDPLIQGYTLQYDLFAEPVIPKTYKLHVKKKYITSNITSLSNVNDPFLTRYVMADLDTLVGYNIYYSLKLRPPNDDKWYFFKSHELIAENIVTIDPGFVVNIVPLETSSIDSMRFQRTALDHYINRYLTYQVQEYTRDDYLLY